MAWLQDLRHSLRSLARQPTFLVVIVLTAAVGIGATTSVFSVVSSVLLNPLPYPEPDRLVRLYDGQSPNGEQRNFLPAPDLVDYRERSGAFSSFGAFYDYRETGLDLTGSGPPERVRALAVSSGYFDVFGARPLHGRVLLPEEEIGGEDRYGAPVAVLSHHLWQAATGGNSEIVGETLQLDGKAYTVVGVLRPGFLDVLQGEIDLWIPLNLAPSNPYFSRSNWYLSAVARLAPEVSVPQAQARVDSVLESINAEVTENFGERFVQIVPLFDDVVGSTPPMLMLLFGASILVLLIASVNVANLMLARVLARRRELAVRAALGSGRYRLGRQLFLESGIAATLGGLFGIVTAYGGVKALLAVSPESLARSEEVAIDPWLLGFGLGLIGLTTLLFSLAPVFQAARIDPAEALQGGARGGDVSLSGRRFRMGLVALQVALATILLIGAGGLLRSFAALHRVPLEFNPSGVLAFEVNLPDGRYGEASRRMEFHRQFQERLQGLPGVEAAGAISKLPALGPYNTWGVRPVEEGGEAQWSSAEARVIEGAYFEALDISLLQGRLFDGRDREDQSQVVVVNHALAELVFPGESALGRQIQAGDTDRTIIGVVADVPYDHLGSIRAKFYLSHSQFGDNRNWALTQVVKTASDPLGLVGAIRSELNALDGELVLHRPAAFADLLGRQRASQRFVALLMVVFAAVALALAVIGIYGVLAFTVTQRRREIGIRVAIGAQPYQVLRIILGQGLILASLGLAIGLPIAWLSGRALDALLFEVRAQDPWVFLLVGISLAAIALVAGLPSARRALRIDPIVALRED